MKINFEEIGDRIRRKRIERHITQEMLSEMSGLSIPQISRIECGKSDFRMQALVGICNALQITADLLLYDVIDTAARPQFERDLARIVDDCTDAELRAIVDLAAAAKDTLRRNFAPPADD